MFPVPDIVADFGLAGAGVSAAQVGAVILTSVGDAVAFVFFLGDGRCSNQQSGQQFGGSRGDEGALVYVGSPDKVKTEPAQNGFSAWLRFSQARQKFITSTAWLQ